MTPPFIVLDGPDGSGTTFHSAALAEKLRIHYTDVCLTAEPSTGRIGSFIRQTIASEPMDPSALQLLFCADRADHVARIITPALALGLPVICDRYASSTIAYGVALGLDGAWLADLNSRFPRPAATLFLLPPLEVALARLGKRPARDVLEGDDLQRRVHHEYRAIAAQNSSIAVIDSSGPKDDVSEKIWQSVKSIL